MLITNVEVSGRRVDVRISSDRILAIGAGLRSHVDEDGWDARGGALLPGLHDHHVHLHAMAAAMDSVLCGPPTVTTAEALVALIRKESGGLRPGEWLRGVGYHESVAGDIDRWWLDTAVADHPVRIQHRSGALWMLNTLAAEALGLAPSDDGRLWRADGLLRARSGSSLPDLAQVSARLTEVGITGVTDATPDLDPAATNHLVNAALDGTLRQRLVLLGAPDDLAVGPRVTRGPRKLLLHDHDLPTFSELATVIAATHAINRGVAVHCVTRESLLLTLAAIDHRGAHPDDRIEHAAVVPPDVVPRIADLGLSVVTQPAFIYERGDDYRKAVAADDLPHLYPCASLKRQGIRVALSSDAPYADIDPWRTIAAAVTRRTRGGSVLGPDERLTPYVALAGYLAAGDDPGGAPRTVALGEPADLCLLAEPLDDVLCNPSADAVALTVVNGQPYPRCH